MIAMEKFAILRAATFQIIDFHCKFQTKSCTDNQSKVIWIMLDQFQFQMQLNNLKCKTKTIYLWQVWKLLSFCIQEYKLVWCQINKCRN